MKNLPEQVAQSIRERKLLRRGESILAAVSGGLDSMVLLHLLHKLAPLFGWKISVAHFNHQLRGRASDADEQFVRKMAAMLGLPVLVGCGPVTEVAQRTGLSIEMAARDLRHRFLAQAARQRGGSVIALAHHADDQLELFLLRLLRGAGGDGLAGMKWRSNSPADGRVRLVRPLLDVNKDLLARYASSQKIRYREDATNRRPDMLRNRVRHELVPLLRRRFQPALGRTILRAMDIIGADAELAHAAAIAWLKLKPTARRIADEPVALQRRIVQFQLQRLRIEAEFDLIESLRSSLTQPVTVAAGRQLLCDEAGRVSRVKPVSAGFRRRRKTVQLRSGSGSVAFSGVRVAWHKLARPGADLDKPVTGREVFDAESVGSRIILRHWRAGDRFQPIGMTAAVKLQDWFTNRKISRERRRESVLATTARGEIFWVEGERIGERFKLTPATRQRLVWRWNRSKTT